ncbi:hypothetical protein QE152_g33432 [Popillia japonica]|uniref:Uncharacterized protein n=1 Tax=Popillia japonica TaxID=7064 RepID=A0AAW1IWT2_POPJA
MLEIFLRQLMTLLRWTMRLLRRECLQSTDTDIVDEISVAEQGEIDAEDDSAQNYDCGASNCAEAVTAIKTVIPYLESVDATDK